jgi:hypothetical protein
VWVRGPRPGGRVVWAANHHSWWDPFIAGALLTAAGHRMVLLADVANVHRYQFARRIGSEVDADGASPEVTRRLTERLRADLDGVDRLSATAEPRQPLPGFSRVVRGRRSWDERVDAARD